jgi:hypothetical protein
VARRFLAELRSDPAYWKRRVVEVTEDTAPSRGRG